MATQRTETINLMAEILTEDELLTVCSEMGVNPEQVLVTKNTHSANCRKLMNYTIKRSLYNELKTALTTVVPENKLIWNVCVDRIARGIR